MVNTNRFFGVVVALAMWIAVPSAVLAADDKALEQDLEKLTAWAKTYGDSRLMEEDPAKLAEAVAEAPHVRDDVTRIAARWEPKGKDRAAQQVKFKLDHFDRNMKSFDDRIARFKQEGPERITKQLDEAEKMADEAVAEKKPLYFTGGVPQRIAWADGNVNVLAAIDAEAAKPLQDRLAKVKSAMPAKESALKNEIIAANEVPKDNYRGPDKQQLIDRATAAWKEKHPDDQILAVRIPGNDWKRDTRWQWSRGNKAFEKIDRSKLQSQLLIKRASDPKLAEVHVVDLYKDHLSGDALSAVCRDKSDVPVQNLVLLEKLK